MSPIYLVWPKPSCKAQWKGVEDKADRGRGGKTTSRNGQAWSSPSPQWRPGKNGGNWLWNHLVHQRRLWWRDRWWWWIMVCRTAITMCLTSVLCHNVILGFLFGINQSLAPLLCALFIVAKCCYFSDRLKWHQSKLGSTTWWPMVRFATAHMKHDTCSVSAALW